MCKACELGKYADTTPTSQCIQCAGQTYSIQRGATSQEMCFPLFSRLTELRIYPIRVPLSFYNASGSMNMNDVSNAFDGDRESFSQSHANVYSKFGSLGQYAGTEYLAEEDFPGEYIKVKLDVKVRLKYISIFRPVEGSSRNPDDGPIMYKLYAQNED